MNIRNTPRSQNGMLHSVRFTELFVKNNSRQRKNFPSENSTIISALAHSAQTYEALPVSMIRRAGLIQKLRILRSFSCNVKCDSVVRTADAGRQHHCLLRPPSVFPVIHFTMDHASLKHLLPYIHFQYKQRLTEQNCLRSFFKTVLTLNNTSIYLYGKIYL